MAADFDIYSFEPPSGKMILFLLLEFDLKNIHSLHIILQKIEYIAYQGYPIQSM